jgi:flagellar biosynthesis/type III secretory pathway M-ring protein FliF/YscJ
MPDYGVVAEWARQHALVILLVVVAGILVYSIVREQRARAEREAEAQFKEWREARLQERKEAACRGTMECLAEGPDLEEVLEALETEEVLERDVYVGEPL